MTAIGAEFWNFISKDTVLKRASIPPCKVGQMQRDVLGNKILAIAKFGHMSEIHKSMDGALSRWVVGGLSEGGR